MGLAPGVNVRFSRSPMLLERPDGSRYAIHYQQREIRAFGYHERRAEGTIEHPDGQVEPVADVVSDLRFGPTNRRVLGGTIELVMPGGDHRALQVEALGDTGVHPGAGPVLWARRAPPR